MDQMDTHHTEQLTHYPPNGTTSTYIDIVLNKNVNEIGDVTTDSALSSDYNPIKFKIKTNRTDATPGTTTRRTFRHTNWVKFRGDLDTLVKINSKIETKDVRGGNRNDTKKPWTNTSKTHPQVHTHLIFQIT